MVDTVHCVRKTLRLKPSEADILASKAKKAKMNEAEYLRFLISQKPKDYPEIKMLLKNLINEINHIGTNINQITFNNNSRLYLKSDKENLTAYMKKLNITVLKVVELIGNN